MERYVADDWQFGLWSSLSLELIARAALSHISPTLLAAEVTGAISTVRLVILRRKQDFAPTSLATNEAISILREVLPDFPKELADFCKKHTSRRNAELHSGEDVFAGPWHIFSRARVKVLVCKLPHRPGLCLSRLSVEKEP
jgi:hypothetical protein